MELTGKISEFSLPEIFQFLEQGHKKGLLTIRGRSAAQQGKKEVHHLWLVYGCIVAAANRTDGRGLLSLIQQRHWLSEQTIDKIPDICPPNSPLGTCLKSQGLLQAEQLQLLFRTQVLGQVTALFHLIDGEFEFAPQASLPQQEITGLNIPATEATLMGLRVLQDWSSLAEKLPEPESGLATAIAGRPQIQLNAQEWQIWEFTNGKISLKQIAKQLAIPIEKVQQIAFRLIVANLVQEIFIPLAPQSINESNFGKDALPEPKVERTRQTNFNSSSTYTRVASNHPIEQRERSDERSVKPSTSKVSHSFLQNLVGFLKSTT